MMRTSAMYRLLQLLLAALVWSPLVALAAQQQVLILNSYHKGYEWTDQQSERILSYLKQEHPSAFVDVMYIDWKRYPSQATLDDQELILNHRYSKKPLDLIITTDDAALIFALKYRKKIYTKIPIVYSGVYERTAKELTAAESDVTGVYEEVDPKTTMELARKLNQKYRKIYSLHDFSETSFVLEKEVSAAAASMVPPLEVEVLRDFTFQEIKSRLGSLPKESFVLMASYARDKNGLVMPPEQFAQQFADAANVPVFAMYDHLLGHGAIGGALLSGVLQGEAAAKLGVAILKGIPAGKLLPSEKRTVFAAIDYVQAEKFGLSVSNLPRDVYIFSKPFSFFEAYRTLVLSVLVVIAVLLVLVFFLVRNIGQRKRSQRQLQDSLSALEESRLELLCSEANFRESIKFIPVPIAITTKNGDVTFLNLAFTATFGYEIDDIPTIEAWTVRAYPDIEYRIKCKEVWQADVAKAIEINSLTPCREYLVVTKGGDRKNILVTMRPLGDYAVTVFDDITARKRNDEELKNHRERLEFLVAERTKELAEKNLQLQSALEFLQVTQDQLVQASKLAGLGVVVAGVAHELNTPIGNARMVATSIVEQSKEFILYFSGNHGGISKSVFLDFLENLRSGNELLDRNLARAAELIHSFKQVAIDRTSSQRRGFVLNEMVDEVLSTLLLSLKKSPFKIDLGIAPRIKMDSYPGPLGQVLVNLVENAIFHGFHERSVGNICISGWINDDYVELLVADDGVGIAEENVKRVFDPFFTTQLGHGGSGLGLNIVYNIVTGLLGGTITCESSLGHGARFKLRLPLIAPKNSED